ncbi:MAG: maltose/maltodextrin ABC transporter substrate-binding protein MalE [Alteromonadaceae bacterium]|uniref:maltose/maltodextrin ABC transporter substrate-binding protein MalE n=1 Tax=Marinobacter sp. V034 TaxID=3459610 RepID=UPI000C5A933C|nr:maltose/maltodextrin ABC transporter substrate-binding protein MalE [Alteromonadaceae bacterium]MBH85549.1 maltose/maltodextrin ABC transporter substrate-binding protein MalE [Alteromonadaceae bacterium]|tara:strand:- start:33610 stop:34803 length:1194 start_codon:yes stop_codon:yes gene_type:complete
MNRRKFIRSTLAVSILATLGAVSPAQADIQEGKLVVWINGDKGYNGLQEVGDWFAEETGITVEVAHPDSATDKFQQSAATGNGPDIFIWAHDRLGEWAQSGLIAELNPSQSVKDANYDFTWDAVTVDGKVYGYPMAVESIGLIYNKDLVSEPPKTFEEIPALDKKLAEQGKKAILWDYNNTYFTWPMMAANGGYIFAKSGNSYDVKDTGVNSDGAIKGATVLESLIEQGVMPRGADYGAMDSRFNKGELAMMISGPWAWGNLKKSGINFGVTTLPTINGSEPKPMVGVMAATLNTASPNRALAVEFLENYALSVKGLKMVNDDVPLGAVANKELMDELSADPNINATFKNAEMGEPMPSVPAMGAFWSSMAPALQNITSGRQSVEEALNAAAKRITR